MAAECPAVRIPRVTALVVDPSDHCIVWAGIEVDGVRRSTDGGDTWTTITNGIDDPDIHDMGVIVDGKTTVLTTTPREIFASTDRGDTWHGLGVAGQSTLPFCQPHHAGLRPAGPRRSLTKQGITGGSTWRAIRCHVRFQGFQAQNLIRIFVSVATFDAGIRGGGRTLSDG
jgi:hypothetical protein